MSNPFDPDEDIDRHPTLEEAEAERKRCEETAPQGRAMSDDDDDIDRKPTLEESEANAKMYERTESTAAQPEPKSNVVYDLFGPRQRKSKNEVEDFFVDYFNGFCCCLDINGKSVVYHTKLAKMFTIDSFRTKFKHLTFETSTKSPDGTKETSTLKEQTGLFA
jgi:hypothetical protein